MTGADVVRNRLAELANLATEVATNQAALVDAIAVRTLTTLREGGRLLFCGNGGSAADAQHLAAEYVVRFTGPRQALPAMALTTDTSVLTAAANDFGFESVFARQIDAVGRPGDLLFLHSTSGESANLIQAADAARRGGIFTVGMVGKGGGTLADRVDLALVVPSDVTARIQEIHLTLGHIVCEMVDRAWSEAPT